MRDNGYIVSLTKLIYAMVQPDIKRKKTNLEYTLFIKYFLPWQKKVVSWYNILLISSLLAPRGCFREFRITFMLNQWLVFLSYFMTCLKLLCRICFIKKIGDISKGVQNVNFQYNHWWILNSYL